MVLRDEIERFMVDCVRSKSVSYETPADFDKEGFLAYQAVTQIDSDRWWIARAYCKRKGKSFLLVHWNGPSQERQETILPYWYRSTLF
jgi:hypothetical protein